MISDIWRCDGREILPLMLDDSASRWFHESRSARYSERLFAQKDARSGRTARVTMTASGLLPSAGSVHIYLTATREGPGRVFRVEPLGTIDNDPNVTDKSAFPETWPGPTERPSHCGSVRRSRAGSALRRS